MTGPRTLALVVVLSGAACGDDDGTYAIPDAGGDASDPPPDGGAGAVLRRASRSSAIAITGDDGRVVMVNPDDDSISIFTTSDDVRVARVVVGDEPSAVVIHPDDRTAFVANRGDATVVKVSGIDGATPAVSAPIDVGSEPTGVALSPTGARLFVAELGEGRVSVIDTSSLEVVATIDAPQNPKTVLVTNDGDGDDDDELLIVPELFGEKAAGSIEGADDSRQGRVRIYGLGDLAPQTPIVLQPIDSGFVPDGSPEGTPSVVTSPNQLAAVDVQGSRIYVTSISASPAGPVKFNANVQPVVYVGDLAGRTEDRSASGTTNLARRVFDEIPSGTRFALADLADISFVGTGESNVAYVLSRGADVVQRVVYTPGVGLEIGSSQNVQIDVGTVPAGQSAACQTPIGIVAAHDAARAYVSCWVNRRLGVLDLSTQSLVATVESANAPSAAEEVAVQNGKRFFFTARGRWSKDGWSSCGSCHPDGLTDNVTWLFAAGPRQTTSLDGSYSHGPGAQKQRVFNWTGIFDEMHDFERNTRGTSGGKGAVTTPDPAISGAACGNLAEEAPATLGGFLAQPVKEVQDQAGACTNDWDEIDAYVKTIRPPRARRALDAASVARGAILFGEPDASTNAGGCVRCHGGPGFTASRRFFTPSSSTNAALDPAAFVPPVAWPAGWNAHTEQIQNEAGTNLGPAHVACVLRAIGTFGVPGDETATAALERRDTGTTTAQGAGGYNVPSLYGLAVGAPYLHHGQAGSLEELFTDARWDAHTTAGNPNFLKLGDAAQDRQDLINYLLSIDAAASERPIPAGWDGCLSSFP